MLRTLALGPDPDPLGAEPAGAEVEVVIVRCARCQTAYRLERERIPERGMRVRCPGCGHVFRVRLATASDTSGPTPRVSRSRTPASADDLGLERDERRPPRARPTVRQTATRSPKAPKPLRRPLGGERTVDFDATESRSAPETRLETPPFVPGATPRSTQPPRSRPRPSPKPRARSRDDLRLASETPEPFERPAAPPPDTSPSPASPIATPSPLSSGSASSTAVATRRAHARDDSSRERAQRLARVIVSDILVYNQEDRDRALREGTLASTLGAEVNRAWELYKSKVDPEVLRHTSYFKDALNEILADGQKVF